MISAILVALVGVVDVCVAIELMRSIRLNRAWAVILIGICTIAGFLWTYDQNLLLLLFLTPLLLAPPARLVVALGTNSKRPLRPGLRLFLGLLSVPSLIIILGVWWSYLYSFSGCGERANPETVPKTISDSGVFNSGAIELAYKY